VNYFFLLLIILVGFYSCGPIQSTVEINQATVEIQSAYRVGANKTAPYYYYKAKSYLYKAKDERAYSDFAEAIKLAVESKKLAMKAREIADQDKSGLLEENELKLEKDATSTTDADIDVETKNVVDQKELQNKDVENDSKDKTKENAKDELD